MDHAEALAKTLFERVLVGTAMRYRTQQSQGQHDFDLCYADGRISAVEVTSSVDQEQQDGYAAILDKKKGGPFVPTNLCKQSWYIHPMPGARVNDIRGQADSYLSEIEAAGIERFWGPTNDVPAVVRIYLDLRIISGSVFPHWHTAGQICIGLPGGGGVFDVRDALKAAKIEMWKDDNRRKLLASGSAERHLAVY